MAQTHKKIIRCLLGLVVLAGAALYGTERVWAETWGVVSGGQVNVRKTASLAETSILFTVGLGQTVEVLGREGEFYRVSVKDQEDVYIHQNYVRVTETEGVVQEGGAVVYAPTEDADGLKPTGLLSTGRTVTVTSVYREYYCIDYNDGAGYVPSDRVTVPDYAALTEKKLTGGSLADEIVAYATEFLGARYKSGSMDPNKGFDCSGFVSYVMKQFGIHLHRSSRDMARNGVEISKNELEKGDLLFYATAGGRKISHVGLYIGDGQFIHATVPGKGIEIDSIHKSYYVSRFIKATRVIHP